MFAEGTKNSIVISIKIDLNSKDWQKPVSHHLLGWRIKLAAWICRLLLDKEFKIPILMEIMPDHHKIKTLQGGGDLC